MNEEGDAGPHSAERRQELLARIPGFAGWPPDFLEELAASLREEQYSSGRAVVTEGEIGGRLYLKKKSLRTP